MSARNVEDIYELSPAQEGMLFHVLLEPASGVYFRQLSLPVGGPLDFKSFQDAWQLAVDRHAVLRTSFHWQDLEKPLQVVHREVPVQVERHDWRAMPSDRQAAALAAFLRDDATRPFDLTRPPVMRIAAITLADDRHQAVWSNHHIALDGWSVHLVVEEVAAAYAAFVEGRTPELPSRRPFADFIAWLQGRDPAAAEHHWRTTLRGSKVPTPLAVDRLLPLPGATNVYGAHERWLPTETSQTLAAMARRHGLTLSTLVEGAWALLLSRYSREDDVVFGVTVSGRSCDLPGVESMVGMLINTLPLRVRVDRSAQLVPWLHGVQDRMTGLLAHEHSSLVDIGRWSELPAGRPLFESILVFENQPGMEHLPSRAGTRHAGASPVLERTNYPLTVCVLPGPELTLKLDFDRRRFDEGVIARMATHLATVLEGMAADQDRPVAAIPLLDDDERARVLEAFNDTIAPVPEACLHELIAEQAARTPDRVAVTGPGGQLSYAELIRRANGLAHHLRAHGAGPDALIAVCLPRSVDLVVALLGVLASGGAYLPLDPTDPVSRRQQMLDDARPLLLLTTLAEGRALRHPAPLDPTDPDLQGMAEEPPTSGVRPHHLAYAIYTSGSTGVPKAAANEHRGIVNRLWWMQDTFRLTDRDRVLHKTPVSFDVSVWELFWPLMVGARLVVAQSGAHADPRALTDEIEAGAVTTIHFVPSMLEMFLESTDPDRCRSLRRVVCSGEALSLSLQRRCFDRLDVDLYNLYGPTEAAVDVSWHTCRREQATGSVPIGRPISNVRLYVLDHHGSPVPIGVPGELYIGGIAVGRGYLNRPQLTAERFVADAVAPDTGGRLYRTGDLVRWRADGELEYLGRLDDQVKVRGVRVEPGEVEAALLAHPAVREAVVVPRDDAAVGRGLVGYLVVREPTPAVAELRALLLERLPDPMVPTAFVLLDRLPLTPNGKVDRRALPAPEVDRTAVARTYTAPRSPIERTLAELWSEVLGIEQVGVHDGFFDLGGHSLLATRLASRVGAAYKLDVPLRQLFEAPTVAEQAELIEELLIAEIEAMGRDRARPSTETA